MKHIIKIFFILIFVFLFSQIQTIYGEENPIDNISYQGYLTGNTIIEINGDLENCNLISISGKKINNYQKDNKKISFEFKKLNLYSGVILFKCDGNFFRKNFNFPYIKKYRVTLNNFFTNILEIKGENLINKSSVFIGNKKLNILNTDTVNRYIITTFPEKLDSSELYITNGILKSNLVKLNIKVPKIIKIESNNGFRAGSTLKIYTKNFKFSPNNFIVINNKDKYQILEKNYKDNYITFKLPNKYIGKNTISIIKNNIKSNYFTLKIFSEIPIIEQITSGVDKEGKKILKIKGKNFINNENLKVKIGKNGYILKIKSISNNEIIVYENSKIKRGYNYIYVELEGIMSNIYNYILPGEKTPSIGSITTEGLTPNNKYRIFKLTTNYFNKKTDGLLLNDGYIKNFGYYGNIIKAQIPKNIVKGYFGFNRNGEKLNYIKNFDFSYQFSPIINYINIKGDFKYGTKVEIVGKNFLLAKVNANNLLGKKDNGEYDISISNSKIIGYLPKNFDQNKNSSITITNNGINNNLSFKLSKINKKRINGSFILEKITNDSGNFIIKQGDIINVFGSYFHQNDTIFLNDKKVKFEYINPTQIKIKLNKDIAPGKYKLKIINNIGIETILKDLLIYNKKLNPKIKFYQEKTKKVIETDPLSGETKTSFNIKYKVTNNFGDLQINKIFFKIENYNKSLHLGNFELKLNGKMISNSVIKENGELIFNIPFIIKKDLNNKQELLLEKDNGFIKEGKFIIILEKIEGTLLINGKEKDINNNIEIHNLKNIYKIQFKNYKKYNCINENGVFFECLENTKKNNLKNKNSNLNNNKIIYLKQLVNSKHKLKKTKKGNNYVKQVDKIIDKYSYKEDILKKLLNKAEKIKNKIKNKKGIKYLTFNNILDYLEAKIQLQFIKNKEK